MKSNEDICARFIRWSAFRYATKTCFWKVRRHRGRKLTHEIKNARTDDVIVGA